MRYSGHVADEAIGSAYERLIEPVDPATVIVRPPAGYAAGDRNLAIYAGVGRKPQAGMA